MYSWSPLCRYMSVLFLLWGVCPKEARNKGLLSEMKELVCGVCGDLISCSVKDEPVH